jgi:VIT1/CCC1 family predicted Fe2+/Mn2+ transporter
LLIAISSKFFNRFSSKRKQKKTKEKSVILTNQGLSDLAVSQLPETILDHRISPLIVTEIKLFIRKGHKWLWLINIIGMLSLIFTPIEIAHKIILPVLWLFQVHRWSDLVTKEKYNRVHYFTSVSYRPLSRLLLSQMIAGVLLSFVLALPLMVRYLFLLNVIAIVSIILGSAFIVLLATFTGVLTGSKKVFEIIFIVLTYMNINKISSADYFGGSLQISGLLLVLALNIGMILISLSKRKYDLKHL